MLVCCRTARASFLERVNPATWDLFRLLNNCTKGALVSREAFMSYYPERFCLAAYAVACTLSCGSEGAGAAEVLSSWLAEFVCSVSTLGLVEL